MKNKLTPKEVIYNVNLKREEIDKELEDFEEISRSHQIISNSVNIDECGYNLYVVDAYSKNRIDSIIKIVENVYRKKAAPRDICLCILDDASRPISLLVDNGRGIDLKECIESLKVNYFNNTLDYYDYSEGDSEKDQILEEIESRREKYIDELIELSKNEGFEVKASKEGFSFVPYYENKEMTEKEYDDLSDEEKDRITEGALNLRKKIQGVLDILKGIEKEFNDKLKELYIEYIDIKMEDEKEKVIMDFISNPDTVDYVEKLCKKIEKDLSELFENGITYEAEKEISSALNKYMITVLVNNKDNIFPRVIYEEEPTINNLFGNIEYETEGGVYIAGLESVYPGTLLEANDGCIIIRISDLIDNPLSYNMLKKALLKNSVTIDGGKSYLDILSISGLKIENIKISTKVVLIGDLKTYDILYRMDEDFSCLFKMKTEYPKEVKISEDVISFIKKYAISKYKNEKGLDVDKNSLFEIIKYLSRLTGIRNKINIDLENINRIIVLSSQEAKNNKRNKVICSDIVKVVYDDEIYIDKLEEYYNDNKILLSLNERKIGSVNGLAVIDTGYFSCGKVIRLTGVCHKGSGKIIDTQKESNMSGKIHEKSISILSGLLNNIVDPYKKLPVDFHLSFEQTYGEIDGDSASVAEMICILSALSKVPVKSFIAVTGSLNQFGEVQPIGGVNEKIEGFFKTSYKNCKNDDKGVIIPELNKDEIILKSEVEEAVLKKKFNIYTMNNINDAIEILLLDDKMTLDRFWDIVKNEIKKYY